MLAINQDPVQPGAKVTYHARINHQKLYANLSHAWFLFQQGGSGFKVGKRLAGTDLAPLPCNASQSGPQACFNVWGRPLADGASFALVMVNNAGPSLPPSAHTLHTVMRA